MKKLKLLFLFLLISVSCFAQPYKITPQLQLKTVPFGVKSDSILAVDATGLVVKVPRSGFGGSQDLQSVLNIGKSWFDLSDSLHPQVVSFYDAAFQPTSMLLQGANSSFTLDDALGWNIVSGLNASVATDGSANAIAFSAQLPSGGDPRQLVFKLPNDKPRNSVDPLLTNGGLYILATTSDIAVPASFTASGIVNNTALQELGGVDKLINGVRVGQGAVFDLANTVLGITGLESVTTGSYNSALGYRALQKNTTGTSNTALGGLALQNVTTSGGNVAIGYSALNNLLTGTGFNTAIGSSALNAATTANQNVSIGSNSLLRLTTGTFNMALGNSSLQYLLTGTGNTAVGAAAGNGVTGSRNTSVGYLSNGFNTSSTGNDNITVGYQAGRLLTTGSSNILLETPMGNTISSGSNNIAIISGSKIAGVASGSNNTLIGGISGLSSADAGLVILASGTGAIAIRKEADNRLLAPTLTNALIVSGGSTSLITKAYADQMGSVINTTTTILSSATLNSTYPDAVSLRVHCMSIIGGGMVYEKSGTGWIQFPATTAP